MFHPQHFFAEKQKLKRENMMKILREFLMGLIAGTLLLGTLAAFVYLLVRVL
jgi:hypothetical protein